MSQKIAIDESMFMMAFERDVEYHDHYPQTSYLDLETGEMVWVFEEDEDADDWAGIDPEENREARERIVANPERYLEVPGRDHGEHHEYLARLPEIALDGE